MRLPGPLIKWVTRRILGRPVVVGTCRVAGYTVEPERDVLHEYTKSPDLVRGASEGGRASEEHYVSQD